MIADELEAKRPTPSTVLVEVAADGFITVYGDQHIQVKIINRPVATDEEMGNAVDELIDGTLPFKYRDIRWPGRNIRAMGKSHKLTLEDIDRRIKTSQAVEDIKRICDQAKGDTSNRRVKFERRFLEAIEV